MMRCCKKCEIEVTDFDAKRLKALILTAWNSNRSINVWLNRLRTLLEKAAVVSAEQIRPTTITMNSRVKLRDKIGKEEINITLVFPSPVLREVNPESKEFNVSILSPMGLSVFGRKVGDTISQRIIIGEISYQPEAAGHYDL